MSKVILAETTKFLLFVNDNLAINQDRFKKLINHGVVIASARSNCWAALNTTRCFLTSGASNMAGRTIMPALS